MPLIIKDAKACALFPKPCSPTCTNPAKSPDQNAATGKSRNSNAIGGLNQLDIGSLVIFMMFKLTAAFQKGLVKTKLKGLAVIAAGLG